MADTAPTIDGFLAFVYAQGVPNTVIVDDTDVGLNTAFELAVAFVNLNLQAVAPVVYTFAVYNLGMSTLLYIASDQNVAGWPQFNGQPFWAGMRAKFNTYGSIFGTVTSTSDEGTSVSVEAPDFVKTLSLSDLQYLLDPWGRAYVAIAQRCGSNWGLT